MLLFGQALNLASGVSGLSLLALLKQKQELHEAY